LVNTSNKGYKIGEKYQLIFSVNVVSAAI